MCRLRVEQIGKSTIKKIAVVASNFPSFGRWKPLPIVLISYLCEPFLHPAVSGTAHQHDSHSGCILT